MKMLKVSIIIFKKIYIVPLGNTANNFYLQKTFKFQRLLMKLE